MVVFTCNNCGETLQKPRVLKHYQYQCRTGPFLTCVDCFKDFRGEEYVSHTKCITEAERYGGKNYVPKANAHKGEKKQQEWINIVNDLLNGTKTLTNAERVFLQTLSKHDNIPRKKAKFHNFVRNILGSRTDTKVVETVWEKMTAAYECNTYKTKETLNGNEKEKAKTNGAYTENNIVENQNNENMYIESQDRKQNERKESIQVNVNQKMSDRESEEKKNKNKRGYSEASDGKADQPGSKKRKEDKNKSVLLESSVNHCENSEAVDESEKQIFNWKTAILDIVRSKGEISLKKLQRKVVKRYVSSCPKALSRDKACAKFNKKLGKISEIAVSEERVKLI